MNNSNTSSNIIYNTTNSIPNNAGGGTSTNIGTGGCGGGGSSNTLNNSSLNTGGAIYFNPITNTTGIIANNSINNYTMSSIDYAYNDDIKLKNTNDLPPIIKDIVNTSGNINEIISELLFMYSFLFQKGILEENVFKEEYTDFKNSIKIANKFLDNR